jgi:L-lactate dehydrogenase complex protein LldG
VEKAEFIGRLPRAQEPATAPPTHLPRFEQVDSIVQFAARLRSVDGHDHGPVRPDQVAGLVHDLVEAAELEAFVCWNDVERYGVVARLESAGARRVSGDLGSDDGGRKQRLGALAGRVAGITGADAGLVESGSIVLRSGPGRPRSASLLAETHIVILPVVRLFRSLPHYLAQHPGAVGGISNLVVVTGPSRTGDIEQQLTLGVHGPQALHVVLVS